MSKSTTQLSRTPEAAAITEAHAKPSQGLASGTSLVLQSAADRWIAVRWYFDRASKFAHASLACQVMVGFELAALKAELGVAPGQPEKNSGTDARILSWEEIVEKEAGISRRTANRFMEMAEGIKPKLARMKGEPLLRELIKTSPGDWSEDDSKTLFKALHEVTSGKTQGEFLCEIGAAKKPAALVAGTDTDKMTTAERAASIARGARETAENIITRLHIHFLEPGEDILHLDDDLLSRLLGVCTDVNHRIRELTKGRKKKRVKRVRAKKEGATK